MLFIGKRSCPKSLLKNATQPVVRDILKKNFNEARDFLLSFLTRNGDRRLSAGRMGEYSPLSEPIISQDLYNTARSRTEKTKKYIDRTSFGYLSSRASFTCLSRSARCAISYSQRLTILKSMRRVFALLSDQTTLHSLQCRKLCAMDLSYFTTLRQYPVSRMIRWLQNRSLLANPLHCGTCQEDMIMVQRSDGHVDGYQWLVICNKPCILYVYLYIIFTVSP